MQSNSRLPVSINSPRSEKTTSAKTSPRNPASGTAAAATPTKHVKKAVAVASTTNSKIPTLSSRKSPHSSPRQSNNNLTTSDDKVVYNAPNNTFGSKIPLRFEYFEQIHSDSGNKENDKTIVNVVKPKLPASTMDRKQDNDSVEQLLVTLNNKEEIQNVTSITTQGPISLRLTNSSGSINYPVVVDRRRRTSGTPSSARSRSMSPSSVVMSRTSRASSCAGENENFYLKPSSPLHAHMRTRESLDNDESEWDSTKELSLSPRSNHKRGVIQRQESEWDDTSSLPAVPVKLSAKKDKSEDDSSTWDSESKLDLTVVETPRWNSDSYLEEKNKTVNRMSRKSESDWDSSTTNEIVSQTPIVPNNVKSASAVDVEEFEEVGSIKASVEIIGEEALAPIKEEKSLNSSEGDTDNQDKAPHFPNLAIDKLNNEDEDWDSTLSEDIPGIPTDRSITSPGKKQAIALGNSLPLKSSVSFSSSSSASSDHSSKSERPAPSSTTKTNNKDENAAAQLYSLKDSISKHENKQLAIGKISTDTTRLSEDVLASTKKEIIENDVKESTSARKDRAKKRLAAYQHSGSKISFDSDNSAIDSVQDTDFTSPLGSYLNGILEGGHAEAKETARAAKAAYRMKHTDNDDGLSYPSSSESLSLPKSNKSKLGLSTSVAGGFNFDQVEALKREIAMLQSRLKSTSLTAQQLEELQNRYDAAQNQRQSAEQEVRDLNAQLQRQITQAHEEEQKRKNAENMLLRIKAQLDLKQEECYKEQSERQKSELNLRSLHVDLESVRQQEQRVQLERDELHRQLEHERETRFAMEREWHQEHTKLRNSLRESKDEQRSDNGRTIEEAYKRLKSESSENLATELSAYRSELDRMRNRLKDERDKWIAENEELRNQVDNLAQEAKLNEEALGSASLSYNYQINALQEELHLLHAQLDKNREEEQQMRLKLGQTQIDLVHASQNQNREVAAADSSSSLQAQLEDYMREWNEKLEVREQELLELRQTNRALLEKVTSAETRISIVELEMKRAQGVASERGVQIKNLRFELSRQNKERDELLKDKKITDEENVRLQTRIESMNDKLNDLQTSNVAQQQQVQALINNLGIKENHEVHDNLVHILQVIRNDHEKNKHELQDRHANLSHELIELRTELRNAHQHIERDEAQLQILRQEHTSAIKKLSHVEADLAFTKQSKSGSENELWKVKQEVEVLRKLQQQHDQQQQAERNVTTRFEGMSSSRSDNQLSALIDRIEQVEVKSQSASKTQMPQWKQEDYEERLRHQEVKNQRLLNNVENETQRNEALQRELGSTRENLREQSALVAQLTKKCESLVLELQNEQNRRNDVEADLISQQALWEKESVNMNKLNLRVAQLEKKKEEMTLKLDEERLLSRKLEFEQRTSTKKLQEHEKRSAELLANVSNLRTTLKLQKRRMKELGLADFDKERSSMNEALMSVRGQMTTIRDQMEKELLTKSELMVENERLTREIENCRNLERQLLKSEKQKNKLLEEYSAYKAHVDNHFVERGQLDRYQLELRNEAQNEVNDKLDQVNRYLQDQSKARESIDRVRDEVEDKLRKDFEHRRKDMQMEIEALRRTCADLQTDRDTIRNDLLRLSNAYDQESRLRNKLAERLEWVNNEAAASQAALSLEKERFHSLSTSNLYVPPQQLASMTTSTGGRVPWTTVDGPSSISSTILEHRLRQELQRSISKQVEAGDCDPILQSQLIVPEANLNSEVLRPKSFSPAVSEPTNRISRPTASPPHSHLGFVTKDPLSPSTLRLPRHRNALNESIKAAALASTQFLHINGNYEPSEMDLSYLGFLKRKFML